MQTPQKPKRKRQDGDAQRRLLRWMTLAVMGLFVVVLALLAVIITTRPPPAPVPLPTLVNPQPNELRIDLTNEAIVTALAQTEAAKPTETATQHPTLPPTWTVSSSPTPAPISASPTPSVIPPLVYTLTPFGTQDATCAGVWSDGTMIDLNRNPGLQRSFAALVNNVDVQVLAVTQGQFCLLENEIAPGPDYREERLNVYLTVQVTRENLVGVSSDLTDPADRAQLVYLGDLTRLLIQVLQSSGIPTYDDGVVSITFTSGNSWRLLTFTWAQVTRGLIFQLTESTAVTGALGGVSDLMGQ